jgi:D-hydroxyproline dehydrogenase subunit gamma
VTGFGVITLGVTNVSDDGSTQQPQFRRLKQRAGPKIRFLLNGQTAEAVHGDTLLTAILLNGGFVRRFEFGEDYRAGFCLMGACQDCWVQLTGGRRERACTAYVTENVCVTTDSAPHV